MLPTSTGPVRDGVGGQSITTVSRGQLAGALAAARREYVAEARQGRGGREAQSRYAAQMDAIVRQLVDAARSQLGQPVAVCALGGYGRRTLCLRSDVDLMIVFEGAIGREEERFVNAVLQPLWDLQLVVGHHVRELVDFEAPPSDNTEFAMALLDARYIAGDEALFARIPDENRFPDANVRQQVTDALLALVEQRHAQFNETIYQLEA